MLLSTLFGQFPFLKKLFADSAYGGPVFHEGLASVMLYRPRLLRHQVEGYAARAAG